MQLKKDWIQALRSKRYQQGKGHLKKGDCYCCLGVLCDIADSSGWVDLEDEGPGVKTHKFGWENELGRRGRSRFGLSEKEETHLVKMNDEGSDFEAIADYIEQNL